MECILKCKNSNVVSSIVCCGCINMRVKPENFGYTQKLCIGNISNKKGCDICTNDSFLKFKVPLCVDHHYKFYNGVVKASECYICKKKNDVICINCYIPTICIECVNIGFTYKDGGFLSENYKRRNKFIEMDNDDICDQCGDNTLIMKMYSTLQQESCYKVCETCINKNYKLRTFKTKVLRPIATFHP